MQNTENKKDLTEDVVPFAVSLPVHLQKADEKFILFLRRAVYPITEEQIIRFYQTYVQRFEKREREKNENGVWVKNAEPYTEKEILTYTLAWFDRSLGRLIRKNILTNAEGLAVQPIKLLSSET